MVRVPRPAKNGLGRTLHVSLFVLVICEEVLDLECPFVFANTNTNMSDNCLYLTIRRGLQSEDNNRGWEQGKTSNLGKSIRLIWLL